MFNLISKNRIVDDVIYFNDLVQLIQNPVQSDLLFKIRSNPNKKERNYLKKDLKSFTPHSTFVKERCNDNIEEVSSYLYFDIDSTTGEKLNKQVYIDKYSDIASLISYSCSGNNIFLLVKVVIEYNKHIIELEELLNSNLLSSFLPINTGGSIVEKKTLNNYFFNEILKFVGGRLNLKYDSNAIGLARQCYLPFDDNPFVNEGNKVVLSHTDVLSIIDSLKQSLSSFLPINTGRSIVEKKTVITLRKPGNFYSLLGRIKTSDDTQYCVETMFIPRKVLSIFTPPITSHNKHNLYRKLVSQLMYLNKDISVNDVYSYLSFINNNKVVPGHNKMGERELRWLIETRYEWIVNYGNFYEPKESLVKWSTSDKITLSKRDKINISRSIRMMVKHNEVLNIISHLEDEYESINNVRPSIRQLTNFAKEKNIKLSKSRIEDNKNEPMYTQQDIVNRLKTLISEKNSFGI